MTLPSPATTTEVYLAAIHDRLGEILERLGGGQVQEPPAAGPVPVDGMARGVSSTSAATVTVQEPTKRTRQRPRQS